MEHNSATAEQITVYITTCTNWKNVRSHSKTWPAVGVVVNLGCQLHGIQNEHWNQTPFPFTCHVCGRVSRFTDVERPTLILVVPFHGLGSHGARELNTHIHCSAFQRVDAEFLPQRLTPHGGLHPQTIGPNKLSLPQGAYGQALGHHLVITTRKATNTVGLHCITLWGDKSNSDEGR